MIKTILVPAVGHDGDSVALSAAFALGAPSEAHVDCLYVHPDPVAVLADMSVGDAGLGVVVGPDIVECSKILDEADKRNTSRARASYKSFLDYTKIRTVNEADHFRGMTASWQECTGDKVEAIVARARTHDLLVLGRPPATAPWFDDDVDRMVAGCGRPVLMAPQSVPERIGETIAIAWNNSPEAARAIAAAMPILERARKLLVLTVHEGGNTTECVDCVERIAAELRWHGVTTEARFVIPGGRDAADALFETARERGADLLVMGAYGHSRLREQIFGGVTRRALRDCPLPVLLFH